MGEKEKEEVVVVNTVQDQEQVKVKVQSEVEVPKLYPIKTSPNKIKLDLDDQCLRRKSRREELRQREEEEDRTLNNLLPIGNYHPNYHLELQSFQQQQINDKQQLKSSARERTIE